MLWMHREHQTHTQVLWIWFSVKMQGGAGMRKWHLNLFTCPQLFYFFTIKFGKVPRSAVVNLSWSNFPSDSSWHCCTYLHHCAWDNRISPREQESVCVCVCVWGPVILVWVMLMWAEVAWLWLAMREVWHRAQTGLGYAVCVCECVCLCVAWQTWDEGMPCPSGAHTLEHKQPHPASVSMNGHSAPASSMKTSQGEEKGEDEGWGLTPKETWWARLSSSPCPDEHPRQIFCEWEHICGSCTSISPCTEERGGGGGEVIHRWCHTNEKC